MESNNDFKNAKFSVIKDAISEGIKSGVSDKSVLDIMKEVETGMRKDGRLDGLGD